MSSFKRIAWVTLVATLMFATASHAREGAKPYSWTHPTTTSESDLARLLLPAVDRSSQLQEDARTANPTAGAFEKRLRVGISQPVQLRPQTDGTWEDLPDGQRLWRLVVDSPNATDLRFGFSIYQLPKGATLTFVNNAGHTYDGPYDDTDGTPEGQFWTVPVAGSAITLELLLPADTVLADNALVLASVSTGYRNIMSRDGSSLLSLDASGTCNVDVACPLGDPYRSEIRAVARYTFDSAGSTYLCTGTMLMDGPRDFRPFFLTANSCISTQAEASSMALIWNYQSPNCGQHGGGSMADTQTGGATLRAHRADVDFSLVELNQSPPASYNVYFAGWNSFDSAPDGSIGIHHPSGDVKAITQGMGALQTIDSCIGSGGVATHWKTGGPYTQGTTEGGSSGSPLLVPNGSTYPTQNLVIGTLSGGTAACNGSVPNSGYDCYGKLSVAWDGASSASRLRDWLGPSSGSQTGAQPGESGAASTIYGSPLTIVVGTDNSFQVMNSAIPGVSQIYPNTSTGPADMGWFVRVGNALYAPDFSAHSGTATSALGPYTPYKLNYRHSIYGDGSAAIPYSLNFDSTLPGTDLVMTGYVSYVNGTSRFGIYLLLQNRGASPLPVTVFLAANPYLDNNGNGVLFHDASSGMTGSQNCTDPAAYSTLLIPQTAADGYTGALYSDMWSQIGAGTLNNNVTPGCINTGTALQWNRTVAAYSFVDISALTSFGDVPTMYKLSVSTAGSGSGTIIGTGINCRSTCSANFINGQSVKLDAVPASGSTFVGWSGACLGQSDCTLTMAAASSVTATFNKQSPAPRELSFDTYPGGTTKTILRNSGTRVAFRWGTNAAPDTNCWIFLRPDDSYQAAAIPATSGTMTDTAINTWSTGAKVFYLGCSDGTKSNDVTLNIVAAGSASLRLDSAIGPTAKTIVRNSGTSVTFAWTTSLPSGTTCQILLRPDDRYTMAIYPVETGSRSDVGIQTWSTGSDVFYLGCSDGTKSNDVTVNIIASASASLRFDSLTGPTVRTIVRNSGAAVTFAWATTAPIDATCRIYLRPDDRYQVAALPAVGGSLTDTGIQAWATGTDVFYLRCTDGTQSSDITLNILASPAVSLRFDSPAGPTSKTIVRNSGAPVTFAWVSSVATDTTCRIYLRPDDRYQAFATPSAGGSLTDNGIQAWGTGTDVFYLGCSDGSRSTDISLTILPPAG